MSTSTAPSPGKETPPVCWNRKRRAIYSRETKTPSTWHNYGFDAPGLSLHGDHVLYRARHLRFLSPRAQHIWSNNDTWLYQGYINVPNYNNTGVGYISFAKSIDDSVRISIDGVTNPYALTSNTYNSSLGSGELTLTAGWHAIDIRLANGGGGAGADGSNTNGWNGFVAGGISGNNTGGGNGLIYRVDNGPADPLGNTANNGVATNYIIPADNGQGNLFFYTLTTLTMNGTGTVFLNASNPGKDAVTVNSGRFPLSATVAGALGTTAKASYSVADHGEQRGHADDPGRHHYSQLPTPLSKRRWGVAGFGRHQFREFGHHDVGKHHHHHGGQCRD